VEKATQERPDLVLMDISLPTFDGLTATQYIRQIEEVQILR
jgi:CheY-like chemotaxis protein